MLLHSSLLVVAAALAAPAPPSTAPEPLRWRIAPGGSVPSKPPPPTENLRGRGRTLFEARCAAFTASAETGRAPWPNDSARARPTSPGPCTRCAPPRPGPCPRHWISSRRSAAACTAGR
jgi:hypothetical protein